jgi:hypothetical protein
MGWNYARSHKMVLFGNPPIGDDENPINRGDFKPTGSYLFLSSLSCLGSCEQAPTK